MSYEVNYKEFCEGQSLEFLLAIKKRVTARIEKRKAKLRNPTHFKTGKPLAESTKVFYKIDVSGNQKYLKAIEETISERENVKREVLTAMNKFEKWLKGNEVWLKQKTSKELMHIRGKTLREIGRINKRLKNPVHYKTGKPLVEGSVRTLQSDLNWEKLCLKGIDHELKQREAM